MESKITLTSSDDIAFVTMVNEARANSIDKAFCEELLAALHEIEGSSRYRAVILQARGRIFSAGGDLRQIFDGLQRSDSFLESLISALNTTIMAIRRLPIPVIASVQGAAAGAGFSLAMACDLVVWGNDLQAAAVALCPAIDAVLAALAATPGCLLAQMSGSGATCFGLFATPGEAAAAAGLVARPGWWSWGGAPFPEAGLGG